MKIRTNVSVIEVSCGLACDGPNYSSVLFDLHGISTSNKFGTLSDVAECSSSSIDTFNYFAADLRITGMEWVHHGDGPPTRRRISQAQQAMRVLST